MPDLTTVETDAEKAKRYREEIVGVLTEHIIPILNRAKADGLVLGFNIADNGLGSVVSAVQVTKVL